MMIDRTDVRRKLEDLINDYGLMRIVREALGASLRLRRERRMNAVDLPDYLRRDIGLPTRDDWR